MAKAEAKLSAAELGKRVFEDAAVSEAQKRLTRAEQKKGEAQAELTRLDAQVMEFFRRGQTATAEALLQGADSEFDTGTGITQAHTEAQRTLMSWEKACSLGEKQLEHARLAAADAIYQQHRGEHWTIIKRHIALLGELAESLAEERAFIQTFELAGYRASSEIFPGIQALKQAHLPGSQLHAYVQNLLDRKTIQHRDLPENLRRAWGVG